MTEDDLKNFDESFKDLVSHNYFAPFGRNTNTDRSWKCRACIVVLTLLYHYLKSTITGGIDSVLEAFAQAISDYLNSSYEVIWELLRGHRTPLPNRYATHLFSEICRRFGFCKAN